MSTKSDEIALLNQSGNFELAEQRSIIAIQDEPMVSAHKLNLAVSLARQLNYDRAIEAALSLARSDSQSNERILATRLLCVSLANLGTPEAARPYVHALNYLNNSPYESDRCWIGRLHLCLGDPEAALDHYHKGTKDLFDSFTTQCIGASRLSLGDSEGYKDFLAFSSKNFWNIYYPSFEQFITKMWEGESLSHKSLAIIPHGGFGDYFQQARHLAAIRFLNPGIKEVVGIANPSMHGLLLNAGFDRVADPQETAIELNKADLWCSPFGLERVRLQGASQSLHQAYFTPSYSENAEQLANEMRTKSGGKPCIGIYWHSDADAGETKSVPLHELLPLFELPIHWVVLQRGFGFRRLKTTGLHADMTCIEPVLPTFDDTAALMKKLDAVVSIDSWATHLAGALGIRTWMLANRILDHRYENRAHVCVLYPDIVSLIRQPTFGDWRNAIKTLCNELEGWLSTLKI